MQPKSDAQLLRECAEHGADAAFAEIVARHTNLVYSAALRQVDAPDIATEVAQSVFVSLARGARSLSQKLAESACLAGWLCRSTRNISLNLRRDGFRRHSRERQAMENLEQKPDKKIPELQLLIENDWLSAAKEANFDTDSDVRKALSNLRKLAKDRLPIDSAYDFLDVFGNGFSTSTRP